MEPPRLNLAPAPDPLDPGLWSENPEPDSRDAAEKAVLGSLLLRPHLLADLTLNPADYAQPRHEAIHRAIQAVAATGATPDTITVSDHLTQTGDHRRTGGHIYLLELLDYAAPYNLGAHAEIITRQAARRRLTTALQTAAQQAEQGTPLHQVLHQLDDATAATTAPTGSHLGETIADFLAHDDSDTPDWIIEGLLERQDRMIITAAEGAGKSTLLRQIGVQAASGIHPFTLSAIPPIRVALLDLENSPRQVRRKIRPLALAAAQQLHPDNLIIHCRPEGLDLTNHDDRATLDTFVATHRPDLLIVGPIYKLTGGNPNDEVDVKPAALYLDTLRAKYDVALLLEAHSRKGETPKSRPKEPFGWSGWMRWPEFGIHLSNDGNTSEVTHWRGMRDEREFPTLLNRGGAWPFTATHSIEDQNWIKIKNALREAGRRLTHQQLAANTDLSQSCVQRTMAKRKLELDFLYIEIGATE